MGINEIAIMNDVQTVMEDFDWKYEKGHIEYFVPEDIVYEQYGLTFYTSSCLCPKCGKNMLKSNVRESVVVKIEPKTIHCLRSTFACFKCKTIYSASEGCKMSDGKYFVLRDKEQFDRAVVIIDKYASKVNNMSEAVYESIFS